MSIQIIRDKPTPPPIKEIVVGSLLNSGKKVTFSRDMHNDLWIVIKSSGDFGEEKSILISKVDVYSLLLELPNLINQPVKE